MQLYFRNFIKHFFITLFLLVLLPSCEHLPWDKEDEDMDKTDKEPLFTPVAPKEVKQVPMDKEAVDTLDVPDSVDKETLKKTFPPSIIPPPPEPKKYPVFYEKFLKKEDDIKKIPVNFDWDSESIHVIIPAFSAVLNFSYTVDPAVKGAVTMKVQNTDKSDIMMTKRAVWKLFDQVLWVAGAYASMENDILHIMPYTKMPKEHRIFSKEPPNANVAVRLINVKNLPAATIIAQIKDFLSDGAHLSEVSGENSILIVEDPENLNKITTLIQQLDKKERASWPRAIIRCTNVSCSRIKSELEALLPILGFSVTVDQMVPEAGSIHLGSIERLQVIVASAANKEAIEIVKKWVSVMDRSDVGEQERVYVYKVVSSTSDELLQALAAIFTVEGTTMSATSSGGSTTSKTSQSSSKRRRTTSKTVASRKSSTDSGPANVFEIPVKIFADGSHNRLLIRTTPRTYAMIKALLARIDSMPEQVLMQIMIAEATLGKNNEFGLEFSGEALNNNKYLGLIGTKFSGLNPATPAASTDQGLQYLLQSKDNQDKYAYIRALAGRGNTKILSSPQIVVKSGTEASIDVGKDVPIITRTQTDTTNIATSNEVEYRKVGVLLKLTPVITEGGLISLDIDQEVSQQGPNVTAGNSTYPSFLERHIVTTLAIRNGGTIIMGGIIDETSRENTDSAPWIAEIPMLAKLLGYTTQKKDRIELLMMLTGSIVDGKTDLQKIMQRYKKSVAMFKQFKKDNAPEKDKK
jgi:general secretion pathway protein D